MLHHRLEKFRKKKPSAGSKYEWQYKIASWASNGMLDYSIYDVDNDDNGTNSNDDENKHDDDDDNDSKTK